MGRFLEQLLFVLFVADASPLDRLALTLLLDWLTSSTSTVTAGSKLFSEAMGSGGYHGIVMRRLEAVYEGGVLRPTEKLPLEEHQLVSVVIIFDEEAHAEGIEFELPQSFEALANHSLSRETVRAALSKIPVSMDADFAAERNER